MRILILGASGTLGSRLVAEARSSGHDVTEGSRHTIDATEPGSIAAGAAGHDLVVNAAIDRAHPEMLVEVTRALVDGLGRAGVLRLIVVGGAGTLETVPGSLVIDADDFNPDYRAEGQAHLDALHLLERADTPVDWTVITPPRGLAPGMRTGRYRVGGAAIMYDEEGKSRISMEDFAVALVDEAERPRHTRTRFSVAD